MEVDYQDHVGVLLSITDINKKDILYYKDSPEFDFFDEIFQVYMKELNGYGVFGIDSYYFYFKKDSSIEAYASKYKSCYIISLSEGLVKDLISKFSLYFSINTFPSLCEFFYLDKIFDDLGKSLYNVVLNYICQHEIAHLIQFNNDGNDRIKREAIKNSTDFDIKKHIHEFDADFFACIKTGNYLFRLVKKIGLSNFQDRDIINFLSLSLSSIFLFFHSFINPNQGFYLRRKSHPHPVFRIGYTIDITAFYFNLELKEFNREIDVAKVLELTFYASEILLQRISSESTFDDFLSLYNENILEISDYMIELRNLCSIYDESSVSKRNELIKQKTNT